MQENETIDLRPIPSWKEVTDDERWGSLSEMEQQTVRFNWLSRAAQLRRFGRIAGTDKEFVDGAIAAGFQPGQVQVAMSRANRDLIANGINITSQEAKDALKQEAAKSDLPWYLPEPGSYVSDASHALESSIVRMASGISGLADMATFGKIDYLHDVGQSAVKRQEEVMRNVNTSFTKGWQEGGVGGAVRAVSLTLFEESFRQAVQIPVAFATGGLSSIMLMGATAGGETWNRVVDDKKLDMSQKLGIVAISTAAETLSEIFELPILKNMQKSTLKTFVRQLATKEGKQAAVHMMKQLGASGTVEGFGEAWGEAVSYVGEKKIRGEEVKWDELAQRVIDAGVAGFTMGATLTAGHTAVQNVAEVKNSSRQAFQDMLGVEILPEKYRSQKQRLAALDAYIQHGEPITVEDATVIDKWLALKERSMWLEQQDKETKKEYKGKPEEWANKLRQLENDQSFKDEVAYFLGEVNDLLYEYEHATQEEKKALLSEHAKELAQADILSKAFPNVQPKFRGEANDGGVNTEIEATVAPEETTEQAVAPEAEQITEETTEQENTYTVREGDTLKKVAKRVGVKWDDLAKANGMKKNSMLKAGQVLVIPTKKVKGEKVSTTEVVATEEVAPVQEAVPAAKETTEQEAVPVSEPKQEADGKTAPVIKEEQKTVPEKKPEQPKKVEADEVVETAETNAPSVQHKNIEKRKYAPTEEEAQEDASLPENVQKGKRHMRVVKVRNPNDTDAGEMYIVVVDAAPGADVQVSGDEGYTNKQLQNRNENVMRLIQTRQIAENLDVPMMLGYTVSNQGTPIVGAEDMHVESGNGRMKALRYAYENGLAEEYKAAVREEAKQLGIPFPENAKMPVLVRIPLRKRTQAERMQMVDAANLSTGQMGIDTVEQARADSRNLDNAKVWDKLQATDSDSLFTQQNADFVRAVHETIGATPLDRDAKGNYTEHFQERIENALLAYFLNELPSKQGLAQTLLKNPDRLPIVNVRNALSRLSPGLINMAKKYADFSIIKEIGEALDNVIQYQQMRKTRDNYTPDDYAGQGLLFNNEQIHEMDDITRQLFLGFTKASSAKQIRDMLSRYMQIVKDDATGASDALGLGLEKHTRLEALREAYKEIKPREVSGWADATEDGLGNIAVPLVSGAVVDDATSRMTAKETTTNANLEGVKQAANDAKVDFPNVRIETVESVEGLDDGLRSIIEADAEMNGIDINNADAVMTYDENGLPVCVLFAKNLKPDGVKQKIRHEIVGHLGLRMAYGAKFDALLGKIYHDMGARIRQDLSKSGYANVFKNYNDATTQIAATEEWLAMQSEQQTTLWKSLCGRIRRWLRNVGFDLEVTDADIADMINRGLDTARKAAWRNSESKFSLVTDKATLNKLNNSETKIAYRALQLVDGKLYPPMAKNLGKGKDAKISNKEIELGKWEQADEHPEMITSFAKKGHGELTIDKGGGKGELKVAYNPYIHMAQTPVNDQFLSAWTRDNLVFVEVEYPTFELESGYRAKYAKDPVGDTDWRPGPVGRGMISKGFQDRVRTVMLSRYSRPIRILSNEEVAQKTIEYLEGTGIAMPINCVTPGVRDAMIAQGAKLDVVRGLTLNPAIKKNLQAVRQQIGDDAFIPGSKFSLVPGVHEADTAETNEAKRRASGRAVLQQNPVTPVRNEKILNLPALTELAIELTNGHLTAKDKLVHDAQGVAWTSDVAASIEVLRSLAHFPKLGKDIIVAPDMAEAQVEEAMKTFEQLGIPADEVRVDQTELPASEEEGPKVRLSFVWEDTSMMRLRKTLAHEIGHVIDWTSGQTMKHNNILARVGGLVEKYLKAEIGETPASQDVLIAKEERNELMKKARANMKGILEVEGIKATSPEGRRMIRKEYDRLYEKRCLEEGIFRRSIIKDELVNLSKWWRGDFDVKNDRYRSSNAELYADFMSVLLTQPESVIMERAPETWRMVQNWQENKAEFHEAWQTLQDEMKNDHAKQNERLFSQLTDSFAQAQQMLEAENSKVREKVPLKEQAKKLLADIATMFQDKWHRLYQLSRETAKAEGTPYEKTLAAAIDSYLHMSSAEAYARSFVEMWNKYSGNISMDEIGTYMLLQRIAQDPTLAQRINTFGITSEDAARLLVELENRVGKDKFAQMKQFHDEYWALRQRVIGRLIESGSYSEELNEKMLSNEWYATRRTLSHVIPKKTLAMMNSAIATGRIHPVKGSFEGTSNPLSETVLNDVRLMEGAVLNRVKLQTIDLLTKHAPSAVVRVYDLKSDVPKGYKRIKMYRKGHFEAWDVDNAYSSGFASMFEGEAMSRAISMLSAFNNVWRKGLTTYSPGFILKNPLRDFNESLKNLPTTNQTLFEDVLSWMNAWARGMHEAFRFEFGKKSRLIDDMMWNDYFIPGEKVFYDNISVKNQMQKIEKMAGALDTTTETGVKKAIKSVFDFMNKVSAAMERGTKVGGEIFLREHTNLPMHERRALVHRRIGSPDFARGGQATPLTNNIFIFSNAIVQGYAASYDAIKGDWKSFVKRWAMTDGVMTLVSAVLANGALLAAWKKLIKDDKEENEMSQALRKLQEMYGKISLYNLYNYSIYPLSETEDGDVVFLRFPMGDQSRILSKMFHSFIDATYNDRVQSQTLIDNLSKIFKDDALFNFHPLMMAGSDVMTILGGNNPRDDYHDRPAVNPTDWRAGGVDRFTAILQYMLGEYLPTSVIPSRLDDNATAQILGKLTGLSSFVQISSYGELEQENAARDILAKWGAKIKNEIEAHVDRGGKGLPEFSSDVREMMDKNPMLKKKAVYMYRNMVKEKARRDAGVRRAPVNLNR